MKSKKWKLTLIWSIGLAALIALWWYKHWLLKGTIPYVGSITFDGKEFFSLPIEIPRWWDILAGPLLVCTFQTLLNLGVDDSEQLIRKGHADYDFAGFCFIVCTIIAYFGFFYGFFYDGILGGIFWGGAIEISGFILIIIFLLMGINQYDDVDNSF